MAESDNLAVTAEEALGLKWLDLKFWIIISNAACQILPRILYPQNRMR